VDELQHEEIEQSENQAITLTPDSHNVATSTVTVAESPHRVVNMEQFSLELDAVAIDKR